MDNINWVQYITRLLNFMIIIIGGNDQYYNYNTTKEVEVDSWSILLNYSRRMTDDRLERQVNTGYIYSTCDSQVLPCNLSSDCEGFCALNMYCWLFLYLCLIGKLTPSDSRYHADCRSWNLDIAIQQKNHKVSVFPVCAVFLCRTRSVLKSFV